MVDIPPTTMLAFVGLFAILLGTLIGKLLDPHFRCRQMRRFLRKNYIMLNIVEKDQRNMTPRVVNAEMDYIISGEFAWIIKQGSIYRMPATEFSDMKSSEDLTKALNKSTTFFKPNKRHVRWQEGVPVVFVDRDNVKPLNFFDDKTNVKPNELSAANTAYLAVERKKDIAAKQLETALFVLILIAAGIAAYFSYQSYSTNQEILKGLKDGTFGTKINLPQGATYANGEINLNVGGSK